MAIDINASTPLRFENGGRLIVWDTAGSVDYTVIHIDAGAITHSPGGTEGIHVMDRARFTGDVLAGDARLSSLSFNVSLTKEGVTVPSVELRALLQPPDASGKKALFKIDIEIPDERGGATGTRFTYNNCWLSDPESFSAAGEGQTKDSVEFTLASIDFEPVFVSF